MRISLFQSRNGCYVNKIWVSHPARQSLACEASVPRPLIELSSVLIELQSQTLNIDTHSSTTHSRNHASTKPSRHCHGLRPPPCEGRSILPQGACKARGASRENRGLCRKRRRERRVPAQARGVLLLHTYTYNSVQPIASFEGPPRDYAPPHEKFHEGLVPCDISPSIPLT